MTTIHEDYRLPVRMPGVNQPQLTDRLVLVDDPEHGDVPVRWQWSPPPGQHRHLKPPNGGRAALWRCPVHGKQDHAGCVHAWSAALFLAGQLLGLTTTVPTLNERTD